MATEVQILLDDFEQRTGPVAGTVANSGQEWTSAETPEAQLVVTQRQDVESGALVLDAGRYSFAGPGGVPDEPNPIISAARVPLPELGLPGVVRVSALVDASGWGGWSDNLASTTIGLRARWSYPDEEPDFNPGAPHWWQSGVGAFHDADPEPVAYFPTDRQFLIEAVATSPEDTTQPVTVETWIDGLSQGTHQIAAGYRDDLGTLELFVSNTVRFYRNQTNDPGLDTFRFLSVTAWHTPWEDPAPPPSQPGRRTRASRPVRMMQRGDRARGARDTRRLGGVRKAGHGYR